MLDEGGGVVDIGGKHKADESAGVVEFHEVLDLIFAWMWVHKD